MGIIPTNGSNNTATTIMFTCGDTHLDQGKCTRGVGEVVMGKNVGVKTTHSLMAFGGINKSVKE